MKEYIEGFKAVLIEYAPKIIIALVLLIVGLFLIKFMINSAKKIMNKAGIDVTLQKFLGNLGGWVLKILLFIVVISKLGIETTSFAAILAAAGLAVGLALQGSLSNFAGGVLIMIFKPFKNGDLIVLIAIEKHEKLVRDGQNLHFDHYISFADATLGTSCEIPTVTGKVKIKLEKGIQSGKILRLKGKGLPSVNSYGTGDLLIHINVWTPQNLSKEEKKFFEESKKSDSFIPNPTHKDKSFFDRVKEMFG